MTFEILISLDGANFDPTNPENRVLRGTAHSGTHTILWDGRDNSGDLSRDTSRGHSYSVDTVGDPHPGIGFTATANPIQTGDFDDFTFTMSATDLQADTVLWNSAVAGSQTGRMDMRSELCFSMPPQASETSVPASRRVFGMAAFLSLAIAGIWMGRRRRWV